MGAHLTLYKKVKHGIVISSLAGLLSLLVAHAERDPFSRVRSAAEKDILAAAIRFGAAKSKIQSDYRADLAKALAKGDRIEVYLLDFEMEDTRSDYLFWDTRLEDNEFPIIPYGSKSKILKRSVLTDEQRKDFLPKLQKVVGTQDNKVGPLGGHVPFHGVRIYSEEHIIFQSSFCWMFSNFAVNYPDAPSWVVMNGGDLFAAFRKIMPIPQSEIDRFEAQFGKKAKGKETNADQGADGDAEPSPR